MVCLEGGVIREQHSVLELLNSAILLVSAQIMTCDTEWRAVNRNLAEAEVSE